jgi:O-methyltransferase
MVRRAFSPASLRGPLRRPLRVLARTVGLAPAIPPEPRWPTDFEARDIEICRMVHPFTMTSPERIYALRRAVQYVAASGIAGAIVECGVWRGGSIMVVAQTLRDLGRADYDLFLFDTFEGMPPPRDVDRDYIGRPARAVLAASSRDTHAWAVSGLEETRRAVYRIDYPRHRIHFVPGRVEETIPAHAPPEIALLRLDTDWYESTRHELVHLFPRLRQGGVLIIDDYGHWQGARQAVDEYLGAHRPPVLLNRIDSTGRLAVKIG